MNCIRQKEFEAFCREHRILFFTLPAHTTHLLQPLDVVLFQPYKHYHVEAIDEATRTGCTNFNKVEFLAALSSIRKKTFTKASILSSFEKTGIVPFHAMIVLNKMREHERKKEEKEQRDAFALERTPSPSPHCQDGTHRLQGYAS